MQLVIETKQEKSETRRKRRWGGKGRSCATELLSLVCADACWDGGGSDNLRPVFLQFAGSESETRAVWANLLIGKRALIESGNYNHSSIEAEVELLKTAGFQFTYQRMQVGNSHELIYTVFLPQLFVLDPGMVDPKRIAFCVLSPQDTPGIGAEELRQHLERLFPRSDFGDLVDVAATNALHFATMLQRRSRGPILRNPLFYGQLLTAMLSQRLASCESGANYIRKYNTRSIVYGVTECGFKEPVFIHCSHETFEQVLSEQTKLFVESRNV